jgi:hypothetical protein
VGTNDCGRRAARPSRHTQCSGINPWRRLEQSRYQITRQLRPLPDKLLLRKLTGLPGSRFAQRPTEQHAQRKPQRGPSMCTRASAHRALAKRATPPAQHADLAVAARSGIGPFGWMCTPTASRRCDGDAGISSQRRRRDWRKIFGAFRISAAAWARRPPQDSATCKNARLPGGPS